MNQIVTAFVGHGQCFEFQLKNNEKSLKSFQQRNHSIQCVFLKEDSDYKWPGKEEKWNQRYWSGEGDKRGISDIGQEVIAWSGEGDGGLECGQQKEGSGRGG